LSTYNNTAEHFAVGKVKAAICISLQFDVFDRMITTISASAAASNTLHYSVMSSTAQCTLYSNRVLIQP